MVIVNLELTTNIGLGGFDALPDEEQARALGWALAKAPPKPPEESAHERVLRKFRERGFK
jgi:hypothetical protein